MRKQGPDLRDRRPASLGLACQAPRTSPRFSQMAPRYGRTCRALARRKACTARHTGVPAWRKNGGPPTSAAIMSLVPSLWRRDPKGRGQSFREDCRAAMRRTTDYAHDGQDPSCDRGCEWLKPRITESTPSGPRQARATPQHGKDGTDFKKPSGGDFLHELK